ncbi:MAG: hypothetical protein FIB07_17090 [Candidatus Methanoperedens sp.]|nr:hypothetical protein [Candidatus Methanoperedens sp.]
MSIEIKKRGNQDYVYDMSRVNGKIQATYLGKVGDPKTDDRVKQLADNRKKQEEDRDKKKKSKKNLLSAPENDETQHKTPSNVPPKDNGQLGISWGTRLCLDSAPSKKEVPAPQKQFKPPNEHSPEKHSSMFANKKADVGTVIS